RSFTFLVKFIPGYFIIFDAIINGVVLLISLPATLLLEYKNVTNSWVLILYPATLLSSFITSNSFLVESLGFSMYTLTSSANSDSVTFSLPVWMPHFFFRLMAATRISGTMLNKICESGHPCLVPDLRGKALSFSPLSVMLAVGLSYMAFIMLRYVPSKPALLRVFIMK
ncbi:hypothetical protein PANDA_007295, partial [Ailuropoda melanoleuca]